MAATLTDRAHRMIQRMGLVRPAEMEARGVSRFSGSALSIDVAVVRPRCGRSPGARD